MEANILRILPIIVVFTLVNFYQSFAQSKIDRRHESTQDHVVHNKLQIENNEQNRKDREKPSTKGFLFSLGYGRLSSIPLDLIRGSILDLTELENET